MSCTRCEHMAVEPQAASPGQLRQLLSGAQAEIRSGVLEEREHPSDGGRPPPFLKLPKAGPWPDAFSSGFRCTSCGQTFARSGETYHRSGGHRRSP